MSDSPKCRFCGGEDVAPKYRFDRHSICLCADCGLMFLHPRPSMEEIRAIYNDRYFSNERFTSASTADLYGYVDYISERINKQYGYARIVDRAWEILAGGRERALKTPRWLDVGCGLGYLLDVAFDKGFDVRGTEFNRHAVDYIKSKYVYPVDCGTVQNIALDGQYDVISMMDVIEHLRDPFSDLETLRGSISEKGLLIIVTMDSGSIVSRLLGKRLEDFRRIREHLFFFDRRSIASALKRSGFAVERIQAVGHTFRIGSLLDRIAIYSPFLSKAIRMLTYPKWLLDANCYINLGTKMIVLARPT